jgi:hypothetical protein
VDPDLKLPYQEDLDPKLSKRIRPLERKNAVIKTPFTTSKLRF